MSDAPTGVPGGSIEIWCRYCRLNLDGVVSAVDGGRVAKVQCRTCRHFQDYKAPVPEEVRRRKLVEKAMRLADRRAGGPAAPGRKAKNAAPARDLSPEAVVRALWDEATRDANPLKAKVHDRHRRFAEGDLIAHKAHGLGVVREVHEEDDTISVLFREGFVRLEHDRPREDE